MTTSDPLYCRKYSVRHSVISTRITGIPELIGHEEDGLLAVSGNPHDLALQIRILLENPGLRTRYGQAGRQKVIEMYNQHKKTTCWSSTSRTN